MRTISYKLDDLKKAIIRIGYVGENRHTQVRIDCKDLFKEYPDAAVNMAIVSPAGQSYPKVVTVDGSTVVWDVTDSDLAAEGDGEIQLTFTEGGVVAKTAVARFNVYRSIAAEGPAPDPVDDWLQEASEALEDIEAAEVNQPIIGQDGYWYTWNQETGEYVKTNTKAQGEDGQPGHTPEKGVDYWTAADKAEMESDVAGAIIDDTSTALDKTWSASKSNTLLSALQEMDGDLDDAVYFEETQDDDTIEGIIESEIKDKMTFGLSGNILSIKYDGDTVCTVELPTSQPIPCTGVELNISATSVEAEKTVSLTATLTPSNTTDAVSWNTSDDEVATVNNGVVTGVAKGTATITVTCGSFSDTCSVTVIAYFREPILGYVMSQSNRIDYRSSYNYLSGGTFNDPFLKKVTTGQKVSLKYTPDIISSLYVYMYVYKPGTFTDKCSKVGDDYVLTQAMIDMQSSDTYGILISSERLYSYGQYASVWEGDYTATEDCYVAFFFNRNGVSDISTDLAAIKQAIRIEVE